MIEKIGGRKFTFALLATILSFVLVLTHQLSPKDWTGFIELIGGIYVIGNVGTKITDTFNK